LKRMFYPMRILQVSTADFAGGAEGSAWGLFQAYKKSGHKSWLAVGNKRSDDPDVLVIPNDLHRSMWAKFWIKAGNTILPEKFSSSGIRRLRTILQKMRGEPGRLLEMVEGREDYDFPGTNVLLDLPPERPDIVHCHNLHGGYFDISALPNLCKQLPVILNLRDAWLLSGHCAHSFTCERWKIGCGQCPDLSIYPAIYRDATAYNWKRKKEIYSRSRLYITTPSQWMMDRVNQSILAPAIIDKRVIPNGVDLTLFHPENKIRVREELGLPTDANIVLFAASSIRKNRFKDYHTMRNAIEIIAKKIPHAQLIFLALGEIAPDERIGKACIHFVPHQRDRYIVARYFQAADIYIHAAHAETFSNTVAEAKACGIAVVSTATGAIPEQLCNESTGLLTPPGDASAMAAAIQRLLEDPALRDEMGKTGVEDVRARYSLDLQVDRFLCWYKEIIS
jgi:glycosyltransferase involved in cell wall biosynthesis